MERICSIFRFAASRLALGGRGRLLRFDGNLDAFGRETESYVPGDTVRVRVIDPTRNDPFQRDTAYVTLQAGSDQEEIQAWAAEIAGVVKQELG